jgi:hypothetical protein
MRPTLIHLPKSLRAWPSPDFRAVFKAELEQLEAGALPLQEGLSLSSHANPDSLEVVILGVTEEAEQVSARVGLFYTGIIAGCSCADDPTPVDEINEHCEVSLRMDKRTGWTSVTLLVE